MIILHLFDNFLERICVILDRALRINAARDIHGLQFLHEQLIGIGNVNGREFRRILAALTQPDIRLRIGDCEEPAFPAGVALEPVTALHEALLREFHDAVCGHAVPLHLSETETTFPGTAFRWLSRQHDKRTTCSRV